MSDTPTDYASDLPVLERIETLIVLYSDKYYEAGRRREIGLGGHDDAIVEGDAKRREAILLIERELTAANAKVAALEAESSVKFYWLIELRPAFEHHPPFTPTYYAGWMKTPIEAAQTFDANCAPKWTSKIDAQAVANQLLPTLSCAWKAVEHGFHTRAAQQPGEQTGIASRPEPPLTRCAADRDGDCIHKDCPQLRDGEPEKSRRSCPLADWDEDRD